MVSKMKLVAELHDALLQNVDQAQKMTYVARKGQVMFHSFGDKEMLVKMWKLSFKKSFLANWEGPYLFASYKDGKGC